MPPEPAHKRTITFSDSQNLFFAVRESFGYVYPNYDVLALSEAKQIIEAWRREHNESLPRRTLGERTPHEFAFQIAASCDLKGPETA